MGKTQTYLKKILLSVILAVWFLPFYQDHAPFVEFKKLEGWVTYSPDDTLTVAKWFNGSYTPKKEEYIKEQFGLRNFFLRLRNQVYYSILKVPTAKGVVIGKDNMLYEEKYIESYMGRDFIGEKAMREKMDKLKFVTDTLKKLNIDLIVCFAPGKATYYPEYIPDKYFKNCDTINTNYKWAAKIAKENRLNVIDYNYLFKSIKSKTRFLLYPKTGIHWSVYGSVFAFDSLTKYIEHFKQKPLRHFKYNNVAWSDSMREQDEDIGLALNTLYGVEHYLMPYPILEYSDTAGKYQPRVITISDSYWTNMHQLLLPKNAFKNYEYWYFNIDNWEASNGAKDPLSYNLKEKIENSDVIILMATEPHVLEIGWGFIEDAYELYKTGNLDNRYSSNEFIRYKRWIRTEDKLLFDLKTKAKKQNRIIEDVIDEEAHHRLDSIHVVEKSRETKKEVRIVPEDKLETVIRSNIKSNPEWLQELEKKSAAENKPMDDLVNSEINSIANARHLYKIKARNNKFLCADATQNNFVLANRDAGGAWETFTVLPLKDGFCVIASYAYKFLSVDMHDKAKLIANRDLFFGWEKYTIIKIEHDAVAFKSNANGKYLSLDQKSNQISAKGNSIGKNEKFNLIRAD